ncbi:MAG: MFS transporter [Acidobacteriota bacterium]
MKRCPVCNRELPDELNFCPRDGTRLPELKKPAPPEPRKVLKATLTFRTPDGVLREASLTDKPTGIGSAEENIISIIDPTISRFHAVVERQGNRFVIIPGGQRAEVIVNDARLDTRGRSLDDGDVFVIGQTRFLFNVVDQTPPPSSDEAKTIIANPQPTATREVSFTEEEKSQLRQPPQSSQPPPEQIQPEPPPRKIEPPPQPPRRVESQKQEPKDLSDTILDGRYHIDWKITQGTTSTIYRARRVLLGDKVAVRVLNPELMRDPGALERFRRHAQVAARIRHPNSVQIFDYGTTPEGVVYIVEELLTGMTLRDLLLRERGLTLSRVISIFNQICGAVHAAHINGIVLRDLKPESIFIEYGADGKEIIKVGGYGLAKITQATDVGRTVAGQARVLGDPHYRSPEQWMEAQLDSRSDVYSLGIILFEMLTGLVPFDAVDPLEIARMHIQVPAPDITEYGRYDLDEGVAAVILRALSKDPARRQPTALYLAAEFEAASGAMGGFVGRAINRATGIAPIAKVVIPSAPAPVPEGEEALPSVVAKEEEKAGGAFNRVVVALMAEAFISRLSNGMIKTALPIYALLVFGLNITEVVGLVFLQNIVPLFMRPLFGAWADKYGKKKIFLISLFIRTVVGVLYAIANVALLFGVSLVRGIADSAKGPSASAMIADNTDERHIAKAYSWYTTTKSTSGGIGEALAAFLLVLLLVVFGATRTVTANVAVLEGTTQAGAPIEEIIKDPAEAVVGQPLKGQENDPKARKVARVEKRNIPLSSVPLEDLPKVVEGTFLKKALIFIFIAATILSSLSLILVWVFIKEKPKEKKKDKGQEKTGVALAIVPKEKEPNVWAFALLGAALTAPAYMVTGEFFTVLTIKLQITGTALGLIKLISETLVPLFFGPFFGYLADRLGTGKVIGLRSIANIITSGLFWITPWFTGMTLGLMVGVARAIDEIGKAAFKPTWGAIAAKVSSFNLANRSRTIGILEGGVDASDLAFPPLAGLLFQYFSLGYLMVVRLVIAAIAEVYAIVIMRKYRI